MECRVEIEVRWWNCCWNGPLIGWLVLFWLGLEMKWAEKEGGCGENCLKRRTRNVISFRLAERRGTERKESEWKADPPLLHPFDRFIPECSAQLAKSGQRIQQTGRRRFLFRLFRSWNLANLSNGNRKENGSVPAVKRDGFVHLVSTDLHEIWHVDGHRCTARSCKVWMLHSS